MITVNRSASRSDHRRSDPVVPPQEIRSRGPATGDPIPWSRHRRSDPVVRPPEIRSRGPATGDPIPWSRHRRSDPVAPPPEIRSRGPATGDPIPWSRHRRSDPVVPPQAQEIRRRGPTTGDRRSNHREAAFECPATVELLSAVEPPGSRSRRSSHPEGALNIRPTPVRPECKAFAVRSLWSSVISSNTPMGGSTTRRICY